LRETGKSRREDEVFLKMQKLVGSPENDLATPNVKKPVVLDLIHAGREGLGTIQLQKLRESIAGTAENVHRKKRG